MPLKFGDLDVNPGRAVLRCPGCGNVYSAARDDYAAANPEDEIRCGECGTHVEEGTFERRFLRFDQP